MFPKKIENEAAIVRAAGEPDPTVRLPPRLIAFNGFLSILLLSIVLWWCFSHQVWNMAQGTVYDFFLRRYWGLIPIFGALVPVAAYSVPLLYLQDKKRNRMQSIAAEESSLLSDHKDQTEN